VSIHCAETAEAVVVDGANGACGPSPSPPLGAALAFAALVALVAALVALRPRRRVAALVLGLALVGAAAPGMRALLGRRGDAPERAGATAAAVARLAAALDGFAARHGRCVEVVREAGDAATPIARLALAPRRSCAAPAPIVLEAGALGGVCAEEGSGLRCGPRP
jgi:hypothetical protein